MPIAGKTGTAEKAVDVDGDGYAQMVDQSWWCGYGPTDKTPELVVCVVIENGGHGGTAAAPAALKVFENYFGIEAAYVETGGGDRLMADYAASLTATRPPPTRARTRRAPLVRPPARLGHARRRRRARRLRPLGDRRDHAARHRRRPGLLRHAPGDLRGASGAVGLVGVLLIDPPLYRRYSKVVYGLMIALLLVVMVLGTEVRGSTRWIDLGFFQLSALRVRKAAARAVPRRLARRARASGSTESRTTLIAVGAAVGPDVLVFLQPDIGTALVYGAILLAAAVLRRDPLARPRGARGRAAPSSRRSCSGSAPRWASRSSSRTSATADGVHRPVEEPARRRLQHQPVDHSRRRPAGCDGRGVAGATQTNLDYLPEHETDFVFASLAEQRGFVGASILLSLYLLLIWRGIRVIATARGAFAATAAGAIVFGLLFQTS